MLLERDVEMDELAAALERAGPGGDVVVAVAKDGTKVTRSVSVPVRMLKR